MVTRKIASLVVFAWVATLAPAAALAQDWDTGPRRRPPRVARPPRPAAAPPARPAPARPAPPETAPEAEAQRRDRIIAHLVDTMLGEPDEAEAALPALLRLARARDGSLDGVRAALEGRRTEGNRVALAVALAQLDEASQRRAEALQRLGALAAEPSPRPRVLAVWAEMLRQDNQLDAALSAYERAWQSRAGSGPSGWSGALSQAQLATMLRAHRDALVARQDWPGARTQQGRLVTLVGASATVRRELADALMARQHYTEAAEEFEGLARALTGDLRVLPAALRDLGRARLHAGQYEAANAALRRALSLAGGDPGVRRECLEALTELYARQQRLDAWVAELGRGPGRYEELMLLGRLQSESGHMAEARAAYERALRMRPGEVDAHLAVIQILSQSGQVEALVAARRRLVAAAPRNPTWVIDLADELFRNGRRAEALTLLRGASARAGADPEAHERLSLAFARLGDSAAALRETELVARYDPRDPAALEAWGERVLEAGDRERALAIWARIREGQRAPARGAAALAEVYGRHDMADAALAAWREALQLRPDEVEYHKGLAIQLEAARQLDAALLAWREVVQRAGDNRELRREARNRIVNLWSVQGTLATQLTRLRAAFEATPPDLEAGRDLAAVLLRLRQSDEAEAVLVRLMRADARDTDALVALERARAQRGDLAGAIEVLERLAEAEPQRARSWFQRLAEHALALHRDREAIAWAERALALNPDDAQGHQQLAELYRTQGDIARAAAAYRRALALDERRFAVCFALADLLLVQGESSEAVALYRRVIRLSPDDDLVRQAGRLAIQVALAEDQVDALARDLVSAAGAQPARAVLSQLASSLFVQLGRPLIDTLEHGTEARQTQARALLTRQSNRAMKPLLDALSQSDPTLRRTAIDILARLENPEALAPLLTLAEREPSADDAAAVSLETRLAALRAVVRLGPRLPANSPQRQGLQRRLEAVSRGPIQALAQRAVWALAGLGGAASEGALRAVVSDVSLQRELRASAAVALGQRPLSPATLACLRAVAFARPTPEGSARDPEGLLVGAALSTLGGSLTPRDLATLSAMLRASGLWARLGALAALGDAPQFGDAGRGLLYSHLFSPLSPQGPLTQERLPAALYEVVAASLQRLDQRGAGGAGRLQPEAQGDFSAGALLTRWGLRRHGEGSGSAARWLSDREAITAASLAALDAHESVGVVIDALRDADRFGQYVTAPEPSHRAEFQRAMATLRDAALARMVGRGEGLAVGLRETLVTLAGASSSEAASALLLRLAGDRDDAVRHRALLALAARPALAAQALAQLRAVPYDAALRVREAALRALAVIDNDEAIAVLIERAERDPVASLRLVAIEALQRHRTHDTARAALARAARHDVEAAVRHAARGDAPNDAPEGRGAM